MERDLICVKQVRNVNPKNPFFILKIRLDFLGENRCESGYLKIDDILKIIAIKKRKEMEEIKFSYSLVLFCRDSG